MFIELDTGGVFDICSHLAPEDERKLEKARVPS